jgi:hypothetical protein
VQKEGSKSFGVYIVDYSTVETVSHVEEKQLDGELEAFPGAFNSFMEVQSKHKGFFYNKNTFCFNFCKQNYPGSGSRS